MLCNGNIDGKCCGKIYINLYKEMGREDLEVPLGAGVQIKWMVRGGSSKQGMKGVGRWAMTVSGRRTFQEEQTGRIGLEVGLCLACSWKSKEARDAGEAQGRAVGDQA